MKLVCVVKFVPDVDHFEYDHEKHVLIRDNCRMKLNPDDGCAIGFALAMKKKNPEFFIEVLSMGPQSIAPLVEDLLRVGVDRGTIISDRLYAGSDTWVTSRILGRYLSSVTYDCILTGSHAIDGDTSHVPPQLGQLLGLSQLSCITGVDGECFGPDLAAVEVEDEHSITSYEMDLPAVLSFSRKSMYRLPYVRYRDRNLDVADRIVFLSNADLQFDRQEIGLKGSRTKVAKAYTKQYATRAHQVVRADQDGVDTVFNFLKSKRFI